MTKKKNAIIAASTTVAALAGAGVSASADQVNIQSGDTVWGLAQKFDTTVDAIAQENGLADANYILAGSTLNVNGVAVTVADNTVATTATTTTSADSTVSEKNADGTVTVKAGDTMYAIAERFGVSLDTLVANNGGSTLIVPGQVLQLSENTAAATQVEAAPAAVQDTTPVSEAPAQSAPAAAETVNTTPAATDNTSSASGSWLATAKSILGIPYVWGGSTTAGFDCSGFVQYVRANSGQSNLGRTTYQQAATLRAQGSQPKSLAQAQPGDLLFWGGVGSEYHVEIYLGGGQMIGATTPGQVSSIHAVWGNPVAYSA
ncbi:MAG: C40 family peptidase [Lactobacillaceae bacterium]|jgi:cell wall-associated NlpC family hydrolase|nr:C40 family peptidase [Lactobacillaceae bacterium]